jgi:hypothetical protein
VAPPPPALPPLQALQAGGAPKNPVGHPPALLQAVEPWEEKVPAAQGVQAPAPAAPACAEKVPAGHRAQAGAPPGGSLKDPGGQGVQVVAPPGGGAKLPALQGLLQADAPLALLA